MLLFKAIYFISFEYEQLLTIMSNNILLTEANYKDKYPPLGLMKISTYHKLNGDTVKYSRELQTEGRGFYSKIYIATRFSFHWKKTKELIKYYKKNFDADILIGGIHASINPKLYENEFGIKPIVGSLKGDIQTILDKISKDEILSLYLEDIEKYGIDVLPPDYSMFYNQELPFDSTLKNNYFLRATKGCERNCEFCDVKKICEGYIEKLPLLPIIRYIDKNFGSKTNILFFDDNTLMSKKLNDITSELKTAGFNRGARVNRKLRSCDFNQGMDLRLLDDKKLDLLKEICVNPVRFAFDDITIKDIYKKRIKSVINIGIRNITVYVLFNYKDTPEDFYERISISAQLNEIHDSRIMSFPMKYIPNNENDRKYIGKHWNKRMIRGLQCILNSSHGIVPIKLSFFRNAFGNDFQEFKKIIYMPENYIIYRKSSTENILKWNIDYNNLTDIEKEKVHLAISKGKNKIDYSDDFNENIQSFLKHYKNEAI
jgi:hypothetical protein